MTSATNGMVTPLIWLEASFICYFTPPKWPLGSKKLLCIGKLISREACLGYEAFTTHVAWLCFAKSYFAYVHLKLNSELKLQLYESLYATLTTYTDLIVTLAFVMLSDKLRFCKINGHQN